MTEKQQKLTRLIIGIVLSVLTIAAGVLLIVQSQRIYHSADVNPYSREKVAKYLGEISWVLYLWIAAVIAGGIVWQIIPPKQTKLRGTIYNTDILKRMKARLPYGASNEKLRRAELIKKIVWGVAIAFALLAAIMIGLVVLDKDNYHPAGDAMQDMLNMLPSFLPWVAAALFVAMGTSIYTELSAKYETNEVKQLIVESKSNPVKNISEAPKKSSSNISEVFKSAAFKKYALLGSRIALAVLAVVFVIVGIVNGGLKAVLENAIALCKSCIGIG